MLTAPDRDRRLQGLWELVERGTALADVDQLREVRFYRTVSDLRQPDVRPRRELVHVAVLP